MPEVNACWCGDATDEPFSTDYVICSGCGSLRYAGAIELRDYTSTAGDASFYGSRYWDHYVPEVLQLPRLPERARSDLAGRAIHYLQRLLEYVGPGDRILEIGCAPGSLAALAQQAGFDVTGLELGDEVMAFIRDRFAVDVRRGPLEQADLSGEFDAVVMIDVLEHLPRPLETLAAAAERLRGAGILLLQTPCYRGEGTDWEMLLPGEHLFLYTESAAEKLLRAAGFHPIEVRTSLYPHDMWIVGARKPAPGKREEPLAGISPLVHAMIELSRRVDAAAADNARLAVGAAERDALIRRQADDVRAAHDNAAANESASAYLAEQLQDVRADQQRKQALIAELTGTLERVRADQTAKEQLIESLSRELDAVRADQESKQNLIESLSRELDDVRADQSDKESLIQQLTTELAAVRADQAEKEALIARISRDLETLRAVSVATPMDVESETSPPR